MNLCKVFTDADVTSLFRVSEMINVCLLGVLLACASDGAPGLEKKRLIFKDVRTIAFSIWRIVLKKKRVNTFSFISLQGDFFFKLYIQG